MDNQLTRDLLMTTAIFGFFAFMWFGWAQEKPPPAARLPLGIGVSDVPLTLLGLALGIWTSINTGIVLGMALPNARAAHGVGLALFFPSFLLGGAGPPPDVMPSVMRTASELIPTTHVVKAIQQPWLGIGSSATPHLVLLAVIGVITTTIWSKLANRVATR